MLFHMKDHKAAVLENDLNKLQKDGPAAWADLPEDELFTPAGFSEERAEATSYSNYSYWGSTFRAFFKNKIAVALLIALVFVVGFAFLQPYLPGQADPNLCQVDSTTGIQFRNIAPRGRGLYLGFQRHRPGPVGPHLGRCTHQSDHRLLRGPHRGRGGHHGGRALGLCPPARFLLHRAVQHL